MFIPDSVGYFVGANYFAVVSLRVGRHGAAMAAMVAVGIAAIMVQFKLRERGSVIDFCFYLHSQVPQSPDMIWLMLPHFVLGLGIGVVDSALMPLLADLVDERHQVIQ